MKRSLNCSHSISKNHSFREHQIFNTNNLAILGNNIIIWEPFKHIIINNNPSFVSNKIEHKLGLILDICYLATSDLGCFLSPSIRVYVEVNFCTKNLYR